MPANYTFSLTYACNSRCHSCGVWKKDKKEVDQFLSPEEWTKIFSSLGRSPFWVTLSGGEPFLRNDIVDIYKNLVRICQPKIVNIPTNGSLTDSVYQKVKEMLSVSQKTNLTINLSLDGIGNQHDNIRGVKGSFDRFKKTYDLLRKIDNPNFTLGVHTVVSKMNYKEIPKIHDYIINELKPDSFVSEVAERRVELETEDLDIALEAEDYEKVANYLATNVSKKTDKKVSWLTMGFRREYYLLAEEILKRKKQVIPCYAGITSAQIAPNGDVWPCCVRADRIGNLEEADFDFKKIWFSKKADLVRKSIKNKECYCPLANASYTNLLVHPLSLIRIVSNLLKNL